MVTLSSRSFNPSVPFAIYSFLSPFDVGQLSDDILKLKTEIGAKLTEYINQHNLSKEEGGLLSSSRLSLLFDCTQVSDFSYLLCYRVTQIIN